MRLPRLGRLWSVTMPAVLLWRIIISWRMSIRSRGTLSSGNNVVGTFWRSLTTLSQGDTLTQSSVVGLVPEGQLRRGFLYYLERERARPYRQYLHYNSWFDITHSGRTALFSEAESIKRVNQYKQEMVVERGVTVDGFVMDGSMGRSRFSMAI